MKKIISAVKDGYSPLRIRNFRIYIGGQTISMIGTWMQATAQSWVVWELSHSELSLGIVFTLGFIPFLILGPYSGVLADRLNRRKLLIATQLSAMMLAIVFALLVQTGLIQLWHVYLLAILLGVVNTLDLPAQQAFIGDLSGTENIRNSIAINSTIVQISRMIGPALAGWLIASFGVAPAFWINGLSFIAVICSLLVIKSAQAYRKKTANSLKDFIDSLKFIRSQPIIVDLMLLTLLLTFFGFSAMQMMPAIATDILHGNADVLGHLLGAAGAGALVGSTLIAPVSSRIKRTGLVVSIATVWTGFWFVMFAVSRNLALSLLFIFLSNLLAPLIFIITNGVMQTEAPQHMRARVLSALLVITFGIQPLASLFIGFSADVFGTPAAIFINGSLMTLCALFLLFFRKGLYYWKSELEPKISKS